MSNIMSDKKNINIILVLGGPGCGKSTLCKFLSNRYDLVHIPVGELLMREVENGSDLGNIISKYIKSAIIVPPKITFDKFINEISRYENTIFLVDGYPRNDDNNRYLVDNIPDNIKISKLLYLKCSEHIMMQRISKRKLSAPNRIDNDIDVIKKRISTFYQQTVPVIKEYEKSGQVITIDCNGTVDNIINKIQDEIDILLKS